MTVAHLFVRQMLWRPATMREIPQPVIGLLGPRGSGKTHTLRAISEECGGSIVHALLDFADPQGIDPFAAVALVAFEMMRTWNGLPHDPTFHRVGLSLLALNEELPDDRAKARAKIVRLIADYTAATRAGRRAVRAANDVDAGVQFAMGVTGIGATPQGNVVNAVYTLAKPAIADLLLGLARLRTLRGLERWFGGLLENTNLVDSLIAVSRRKVDPLNHLTGALLADLAQNATQGFVPVENECRCGQRGSHQHAWLLLVDNADSATGQRFLDSLVNARQQRAAADRPELDPLLVVAATGQWEVKWAHWWQEPWETGPDADARQRIPLLSTASPDQWAKHVPRAADILGEPARSWYPVWLDAPGPDEITRLAPVPASGWQTPLEFKGFVRRLSGDLPAAAAEIRKPFDARLSADGARARVRSLFFADGPDQALWQRISRSNLPDDLLGRALWRTVPEAVAVACHLIQPGRAADDLDPETFPEAANVLWALRTDLWITRFAARPSRLWPVVHGDAEHPAVVHPWLLRCLLAGLSAESEVAERRRGAWSWDALFAALSAMDSVSPDAKLYYDLARDRFDDVVTELARRFVSDSHLEWVRLLDEVTAAPCRWPPLEPTEQTVARLAPDEQPDRTPLEVTVANLVALLWLYRDPLTIQTREWDKEIHDGFTSLRSNHSARGNRAALVEAAAQFEPSDGRSR